MNVVIVILLLLLFIITTIISVFKNKQRHIMSDFKCNWSGGWTSVESKTVGCSQEGAASLSANAIIH